MVRLARGFFQFGKNEGSGHFVIFFDGAKTFSEKLNDGARTFSEKKNYGTETFFEKKISWIFLILVK